MTNDARLIVSEIESGVPIPDAKGAKRYHFEDMQVGDSMLFEERKKAESAQASAYDWALRHNPDFKVSRRKVEGGYRLWRIK